MSLLSIGTRLRRFGAVAVTVLGLSAVGTTAMTVPSQPAEAAVAVTVGVPGFGWGWGYGWWGYRPYWGGYYRPYYWGGYYRPYWGGYYRGGYWGGYRGYYRAGWGWRGGCRGRCW
jgi:hypothetical protein